MSPDQHGRPAWRRKPLWLLAGGGFLAGAVVVLVVVLTSGPDTSTPRGVAEGVVDALNDEEFGDIVDLACADYQEELGNMVAPSGQPGATASVGEIATKPGDEASATITFTDDRQLDLGLSKQDGQWCVSFMA